LIEFVVCEHLGTNPKFAKPLEFLQIVLSSPATNKSIKLFITMETSLTILPLSFLLSSKTASEFSFTQATLISW
jgi:hypothetical protein